MNRRALLAAPAPPLEVIWMAWVARHDLAWHLANGSTFERAQEELLEWTYWCAGKPSGARNPNRVRRMSAL